MSPVTPTSNKGLNVSKTPKAPKGSTAPTAFAHAPCLALRQKRIARRKSWDRVLALTSGAVLALVAFVLIALFWDVIDGAKMTWKRAEISVQITYPDEDRLYVDGAAFRTRASGPLSARRVIIETRPILVDELVGSRDAYDPQIVKSVETLTGIGPTDLPRTQAQAGPYAGQIGRLFIDPGPYFKKRLEENPQLAGTTGRYAIAFSTDADAYLRGFHDLLTDDTGSIPASRLSPFQIEILDRLIADGAVRRVWNWSFLTNAYPQSQRVLAGIGPAIQASLLMMFIVVLVSLPVGVGSGIFLEFFAPRQGFWGWVTTVIEININNLASVPSIVFGLMGLAIFVQAWGPIFIFDTGLATPIVGGLILSLMTLPTIVVTSRAALLAVPPSFQQAAYGMGATKMQTIFRFVLPYAFPGIITGVIIGLAQAIGETAPLVVIGMVAAEVVTCDQGLLCLEDQSPALPTAISYFRRFMDGDHQMVSRSYMTIIVLLTIVLSMNALASLIRGRVAKSRQG